MPDGFIQWNHQAPPSGVPLKIYCRIKKHIYSRLFTREEIEAWVSDDEESVQWEHVGWMLTGIAKMKLEVSQ